MALEYPEASQQLSKAEFIMKTDEAYTFSDIQFAIDTQLVSEGGLDSRDFHEWVGWHRKWRLVNEGKEKIRRIQSVAKEKDVAAVGVSTHNTAARAYGHISDN